jgi:uncharacterized protein HemX
MSEGVFSASDALVVVAVITALGTFFTAIVQGKMKKETRAEHAMVISESKEFREEVRQNSQYLRSELRAIAGDVRDVKQDVRSLKMEQRETREIVDQHLRES